MRRWIADRLGREAPQRRRAATNPYDEVGAGYWSWSRDPSVGVFAVLPLWVTYELLRLQLAPNERNGAEALVSDTLSLFGPRAVDVLRVLFLASIVAAAISILRRHVPWFRVALVSAFEGLVYGLMLGPITSALTIHVLALPDLQRIHAHEFIGSLGAGLFEEAVFRLGMLSVLALVFGETCRSFAVSPWIGTIAAVVVSGVVFSWFHHIGPAGEPFVIDVFTFRAIAGLVLGLLFVVRGFGVCVYTHAAYDVHYYMTH